ncbi:MAG: hypothetical protein SGPRY_002185 [Prymnesium sp.]
MTEGAPETTHPSTIALDEGLMRLWARNMMPEHDDGVDACGEGKAAGLRLQGGITSGISAREEDQEKERAGISSSTDRQTDEPPGVGNSGYKCLYYFKYFVHEFMSTDKEDISGIEEVSIQRSAGSTAHTGWGVRTGMVLKREKVLPRASSSFQHLVEKAGSRRVASREKSYLSLAREDVSDWVRALKDDRLWEEGTRCTLQLRRTDVQLQRELKRSGFCVTRVTERAG